MKLWADTVAYVAASVCAECPNSDINIVATQFYGWPAFPKPDGLFWEVKSFMSAVERAIWRL
jgi:hypothetical protein